MTTKQNEGAPSGALTSLPDICQMVRRAQEELRRLLAGHDLADCDDAYWSATEVMLKLGPDSTPSGYFAGAVMADIRSGDRSRVERAIVELERICNQIDLVDVCK